MTRLSARVRSLLRAWFRAARVERDVDAELRSAFEELADRHRARGCGPDDARRLASLDLADAKHITEVVRERGAMHRLDTLWRDIVHSARALRRAPGFSAIVIVVLAIGIGAATAIFSVVNSLLLSPLPYREADRLVFVWQDLTSAGYPRAPLAGPEVRDLRERSELFEGFGGIWANTTTLTGDGEPEQLRIGLVTGNFFEVLGARAGLGRVFTAADEEQNAAPSILLGAGVWRRRYSSDPAVVGSRIEVNGRPATVVGIMPDDFRLLLPPDSAIPDDQQAWMLLGRNALSWSRQQQFMRVVGRMKPGVRLEDAKAEIAAISSAVGREFAEYGAEGATFYGVGLREEAMRELRPAFLGLLGAVSVLLLIACVNLAGLFSTRAAARQPEVAVRLAIGASRVRIFRQGLIEALLLSLAGGALGLAVARAMLAGLLASRPEALGRIDLATLDWAVFAFAAAVSIACGVLFSTSPLFQLFRIDVTRALSAGGRAQAGAPGRVLRLTLVTAQTSLSVVLLVVAGLLARGFYELQAMNPGFSADRVMTFKLSLAGGGRTLDGIHVFSRQLRDRLAGLPGVEAVGAISHLPYDTVPNWGTPYLPEQESDVRKAGLADARAVTPGYFETVGARIIEGRWFTDADTRRSMPVAIVDEMLARRMWPGESALGRRLKADPGTTGTPRVVVTVVGVVAHMRHREITRDLREQMYFPAEQSFRNPMAFAVRVSSDDQNVAGAVRGVLADLDPQRPIYDVRPLASYAANARSMRAFSMVIAVTFAVSALLLACLGVYGVTAYAVRQRRREFGVRLALGASARQMVGLVVREGCAVALGGALAGAGVALLVSRALAAQIYGVSPRDPATYALSVVLIIAAVLLASWIPARRAARTSPVESLRFD